MNEDTYRDKLNDLQLEVEELRAKLAAHQSTMGQLNDMAQSTKAGDLISRAAAIDALDGVSWMHLEGKHEICDGDWIKTDEAEEALKQLPSAQIQQVTGKLNADCISRKAAIDAITNDRDGGRNSAEARWFNVGLDRACVILDALPSAHCDFCPYPEDYDGRVPVVRCKDCKHKHIENMVWTCPFGLPGGELFFCAYGAERRTDEL